MLDVSVRGRWRTVPELAGRCRTCGRCHSPLVEREPARPERLAQLADPRRAQTELRRHLSGSLARGQRVGHRPVPRRQPRPPRREVDPERRLLGHPRLRVDRQRLGHHLRAGPGRVEPRRRHAVAQAHDHDPVPDLGDRGEDVARAVAAGESAPGADGLGAPKCQRRDELFGPLAPARQRRRSAARPAPEPRRSGRRACRGRRRSEARTVCACGSAAGARRNVAVTSSVSGSVVTTVEVVAVTVGAPWSGCAPACGSPAVTGAPPSVPFSTQ